MVTAQDIMLKKYVSIDQNETVAKLLGKLRTAKETFALVFNNKKYLGLITKKWLMTSRADFNVMKIKNAINKRHKVKTPFYVPQLSKDTELSEIARLIATADIRALPVLDKGKVIGIVRAKEVAAEVKSAYRGIPVSEIATMKKLIILTENDEIGKAIKAMGSNHIDRLPIVDRTNTISGIVTLYDLAEQYLVWSGKAMKASKVSGRKGRQIRNTDIGEKTNLLKLPVKNIMTSGRDVCCIKSDKTIAQAITQMQNNDTTSVIIIKNNKPVGILTLKDILMDYSRA